MILQQNSKVTIDIKLGINLQDNFYGSKNLLQILDCQLPNLLLLYTIDLVNI